MRWLRDFFGERDPLVAVAAAMSEPDAEMWRELLENNGIPAMLKNVNALSVTQEFPTGFGDFDLYVKQSDLKRAEEILAPLQRRNSRRRRHKQR